MFAMLSFEKGHRLSRTTITLLVLLAAVAPAAFPGAELVLKDGQVLQGVDVRRDGDEYLLELESGQVVSIPVELVGQVRIYDEPQQLGGDPPPEGAPTGLIDEGPQQLAGEPPPSDAPTGLIDEGPQQLAGPPTRPPTTSEALEVLGEPSRFSRGVGDPYWRPRNAWADSPAQSRSFDPSESRWAKSIIDSDWEPESTYDRNEDVLRSNRSTWRESIIDPTWQPDDAWNKKG